MGVGEHIHPFSGCTSLPNAVKCGFWTTGESELAIPWSLGNSQNSTSYAPARLSFFLPGSTSRGSAALFVSRGPSFYRSTLGFIYFQLFSRKRMGGAHSQASARRKKHDGRLCGWVNHAVRGHLFILKEKKKKSGSSTVKCRGLDPAASPSALVFPFGSAVSVGRRHRAGERLGPSAIETHGLGDCAVGPFLAAFRRETLSPFSWRDCSPVARCSPQSGFL